MLPIVLNGVCPKLRDVATVGRSMEFMSTAAVGEQRSFLKVTN